jgi:hypothetical protein
VSHTHALIILLLPPLIYTQHKTTQPPNHPTGGGRAGPYLDAAARAAAAAQNGDAGKKQGAYGKVKSHSEPLFAQLLRVEEVAAALRVKFGSPFPRSQVGGTGADEEDVAFCYDMLDKVKKNKKK